jgi:hypothetical protein
MAADESSYRTTDGARSTRLLPSGDVYFLLQGPDRALLLPDLRQRGELWTARVWPGAVLLDGEIVGTWRRSDHRLTVRPWRRLAKAPREAIETEARSLPIPVDRPITVTYDDSILR